MNRITKLFAMLIALFFITTTFAQQDGSVDLTFNPMDVGGVNRLVGSVAQVEEQADGKVLVAGLFSQYLGEPAHNIIRLNPDESLDTTFNPGTGTNGVIRSVLTLQDGKLIICGSFFEYNGSACNGIARLNADGSFDSSFSTAGLAAGTSVFKSVLTPNGKIVVLYLTSAYMYKVARLNANGTLDTAFNQGTGANYEIISIAVQSDGKVLVGGFFTIFSEVEAHGLVRLNTNGSVDTGFNLNYPTDYSVNSFTITQDEKLTVLFNADLGNMLLQYNADGSLNSTFSAPDDLQSQYVANLMSYTDNKLWIMHQGVLKRLNGNGSYDTTYTSPDTELLGYQFVGANQSGKIYIAGEFVSINGALDNGLVRLNADGSRDNTFDIGASTFTGADDNVHTILKQNNNKLIISGAFQSYNGLVRNKIARLNADGTLDSGFVIDDILGGGYTVAGLYPGEKVLISVAGTIKRLNPDGSIDSLFNAQQFLDSDGSADLITSVLVLPDGKIIVAGSFDQYGTTSVPHICRLNADGSIDNTFSCSILEDALSNVSVKLIDLPNEQKILLGTIGASSALYKIGYDGIEDATFNHVPDDLMFWVQSLTVEYDGKILVTGFGTGQPFEHQRLIRFNTNGTVNQIIVDQQIGPSLFVGKIVATPDGKYYVAAQSNFFLPLTGVNIARFNNDGTIDATFTAGGTDGYVTDFAFQGNSIVLGGSFSSYNGVAKNNILRLNTSGALATNTPKAIAKDVYVYRDYENLNITALGDIINSVQVYDFLGRLITEESNINKTNALLLLKTRQGILIVKTTLANGTVVTKKIY